MAAQPFDLMKRHKAPRAVDESLDEFWLENPFDFEHIKGYNLSRYERNRLFFNREGQRFADVSHLSNVDMDSDSRAVAIGDIDEDGRPDLVVRSVGGGPLRVFLNRATTGGSLKVKLRGTKSNSQGIGARLWLKVGDRTLYREHFPQNSMYAQSATETIFGLGDAKGPFSLRIVWPSGTEQVVPSLEAGETMIVEK